MKKPQPNPYTRYYTRQNRSAYGRSATDRVIRKSGNTWLGRMGK